MNTKDLGAFFNDLQIARLNLHIELSKWQLAFLSNATEKVANKIDEIELLINSAEEAIFEIERDLFIPEKSTYGNKYPHEKNYVPPIDKTTQTPK